MLNLIQQYARLAGGSTEQLAPHLVRLRVSAGDGRFFGNRTEHLLALSVTAWQQHPEAQLPVLGSAFWNGLVRAIREHGARRVGGTLPMTAVTTSDAPDFRANNAAVELLAAERELRRLMRLSTRLTLGAGTTVEEQLVEGDVIDLSTGAEIGNWVNEYWQCPPAASADVPPGPVRSADQLVAGLTAGLEHRVSARLRELELESQRELKEELDRIDRYYAGVLKELRDQYGPDTPGEKTIVREHEKRRTEETRRHQVKVEVEPLQADERTIVVERGRWRLTTPNGKAAELTAHRYLTGPASWEFRCDCCRATPAGVTVCRSGHVTGSECALNCTVCQEAFCKLHGRAACAVDRAPMCDEHAAVCFSCERDYCTAHQGTCSETRHLACTDCLKPCAVCARVVCRKHGFETVGKAPRGLRFLCGACVTYCEGSTSEPIGVDEAALCGTCGKHICERHQVPCAIDGKPHCSKHLKRADRSRRFICQAHQAECGLERDVIFASDEVKSCVRCGTVSCQKHGASCHEDHAWHCIEHLTTLTDLPQAFACEKHQSVCHVDQRVFSTKGTSPCDVCGQATCKSHRRGCEWCGASVCVKDVTDGNRCSTCSKLSPVEDVPDEVLAAAARIVPRGAAKRWSIARDGGRYVTEINLGWTRRVVFSVPHGTSGAVRVRRHSIFGTSSD